MRGDGVAALVAMETVLSLSLFFPMSIVYFLLLAFLSLPSSLLRSPFYLSLFLSPSPLSIPLSLFFPSPYFSVPACLSYPPLLSSPLLSCPPFSPLLSTPPDRKSTRL